MNEINWMKRFQHLNRVMRYLWWESPNFKETITISEKWDLEFLRKSVKHFGKIYSVFLAWRKSKIHQKIYGHFAFQKKKNQETGTAQKIKFSVKDLFSKCDQIHRKLRIWSYLLKKSLMENFIGCAVKHLWQRFFAVNS